MENEVLNQQPNPQSNSLKILFFGLSFVVIFVLGMMLGFGIAYKMYSQTPAITPKLGVTNITPSASPSKIEISPSISPTKPPSDETSNWKQYNNSQYSFSFNYPINLTDYGQVSGAMTGAPTHIVSFGDPKTGLPGTDAPFDGFTLYATTLQADQNFHDYIAKEKEALLNSYEVMHGKKNPNPGEEMLIMFGGKQGIRLKGYGWDGILRYYVLMPDQKTVLSVGRVSKNLSFNKTFDQILLTFKFTN